MGRDVHGPAVEHQVSDAADEAAPQRRRPQGGRGLLRRRRRGRVAGGRRRGPIDVKFKDLQTRKGIEK